MAKSEEGLKGVSGEMRDLLARKAEAVAKLNLAAAEAARQRAEVATLNAQLIRADTSGILPLRVIAPIARW